MLYPDFHYFCSADLIGDADLDAYYHMDTSIIGAFTKDEVSALTRYIDHLSPFGRHFFIIDRIARECLANDNSIPPQFTVFENNDATVAADSANKYVMAKFNTQTPEFMSDMSWLPETGQCIHSCEDTAQIAPQGGSVFALTLNAELVDLSLSLAEH